VLSLEPFDFARLCVSFAIKVLGARGKEAEEAEKAEKAKDAEEGAVLLRRNRGWELKAGRGSETEAPPKLSIRKCDVLCLLYVSSKSNNFEYRLEMGPFGGILSAEGLFRGGFSMA
jgi:hypothetical protein